MFNTSFSPQWAHQSLILSLEPHKGCVQSSCQHGYHYNDPHQAIRELWGFGATHSDCPETRLHPVPCHAVTEFLQSQFTRLPQSWEAEDPLCPCLSHPQRGRDISRASCLWALFFGNLSPRACDILRNWDHLTVLRRCTSQVPSLLSILPAWVKVSGNADFSLWENLWITDVPKSHCCHYWVSWWAGWAGELVQPLLSSEWWLLLSHSWVCTHKLP